MDDAVRHQQGVSFLRELFGDKPETAAIQVWIRAPKPVTWFVATPEEAATIGAAQAPVHDVYVGCGLAHRIFEKPQRSRAKADEVVGIPGVWADIDVNGGPEGKDKAAPTVEAAMELAGALLEPTVLVKSGYGIQAWWLFEDGPWMFHSRPEQDQAARIVAGFQGALRAAARRLGWGLDATQDLSRVMRLPGTCNHKGKKPVDVKLVQADGKRYGIDEIGQLGQGFSTSAPDESRADIAIEVKIGNKPPAEVFELLHQEPDFSAVWEQRTGGRNSRRRNWTPSEFELSICNWLVQMGLDDQEIADTLVYWRNKIDPGDPRGKCRRERIARTIEKVRSTVRIEAEREIEGVEREEAIERLDRIASGKEEPNEARTLGAFNQIISGPEIAQLKQRSRDPEMARFSIELADGREVNLGRFETLTDQRSFRKVYGIATGHYPPSVGAKKWDQAVAGLLKAANVIEDDEETRESELGRWVGQYFEATGSTDKDGACASGAPYTAVGRIHVHIDHFLKWLRRSMGERLTSADLIHELGLLGFERKTITYRISDSKRSSRSYYVRDEELEAAA